MMMSLPSRIINRVKNVCVDTYYRYKNAHDVKEGAWQPEIMTMEETLNEILDKHLSISRFGDGEFKWMLGAKQLSFQDENIQLRKLLNKTFALRDERLLICIPDTFGDLSKYNKYATNYWSREMCLFRYKIKDLVGPKLYKFGNPFITRFYMDYIDKNHVEKILSLWKEIFQIVKYILLRASFPVLALVMTYFLQHTLYNVY